MMHKKKGFLRHLSLLLVVVMSLSAVLTTGALAFDSKEYQVDEYDAIAKKEKYHTIGGIEGVKDYEFKIGSTSYVLDMWIDEGETKDYGFNALYPGGWAVSHQASKKELSIPDAEGLGEANMAKAKVGFKVRHKSGPKQKPFMVIKPNEEYYTPDNKYNPVYTNYEATLSQFRMAANSTIAFSGDHIPSLHHMKSKHFESVLKDIGKEIESTGKPESEGINHHRLDIGSPQPRGTVGSTHLVDDMLIDYAFAREYVNSDYYLSSDKKALNSKFDLDKYFDEVEGYLPGSLYLEDGKLYTPYFSLVTNEGESEFFRIGGKKYENLTNMEFKFVEAKDYKDDEGEYLDIYYEVKGSSKVLPKGYEELEANGYIIEAVRVLKKNDKKSKDVKEGEPLPVLTQTNNYNFSEGRGRVGPYVKYEPAQTKARDVYMRRNDDEGLRVARIKKDLLKDDHIIVLEAKAKDRYSSTDLGNPLELATVIKVDKDGNVKFEKDVALLNEVTKFIEGSKVIPKEEPKPEVPSKPEEKPIVPEEKPTVPEEKPTPEAPSNPDTPVIDEPIIEEPVVDEPIIDEPVVDEPEWEWVDEEYWDTEIQEVEEVDEDGIVTIVEKEVQVKKTRPKKVLKESSPVDTSASVISVSYLTSTLGAAAGYSIIKERAKRKKK